MSINVKTLALLAKDSQNNAYFKIISKKDGKVTITVAENNELDLKDITIDSFAAIKSAKVGATVTVKLDGEKQTFEVAAAETGKTGSTRKSTTPAFREPAAF